MGLHILFDTAIVLPFRILSSRQWARQCSMHSSVFMDFPLQCFGKKGQQLPIKGKKIRQKELSYIWHTVKVISVLHHSFPTPFVWEIWASLEFSSSYTLRRRDRHIQVSCWKGKSFFRLYLWIIYDGKQEGRHMPHDYIIFLLLWLKCKIIIIKKDYIPSFRCKNSSGLCNIWSQEDGEPSSASGEAQSIFEVNEIVKRENSWTLSQWAVICRIKLSCYCVLKNSQWELHVIPSEFLYKHYKHLGSLCNGRQPTRFSPDNAWW